jgi:hypothetical protein
MEVVLRVTAGPHAGRKHVWVGAGSFWVGRSSCAPFSLPDDELLSRQHFQIGINPSHCVLRDCGSTNATWINGRRVSWELLRHGDMIWAGTSEFAVGITGIVPGDGDLPSLPCPDHGAAAPAGASSYWCCFLCNVWQSEARSEILLLRFLNPAQRSRYLSTREFVVLAPSGCQYLITRGTSGNVFELDGAGQRLRRYCIYPEGVPRGDVMLSQMLMLLTDEDSFRGIAVATDLPTGRRSNRRSVRRAPRAANDRDDSDRALDRFDATERRIIDMRRIGYTNAEIAEHVGWELRSVQRFMKVLRKSVSPT